MTGTSHKYRAERKLQPDPALVGVSSARRQLLVVAGEELSGGRRAGSARPRKSGNDPSARALMVGHVLERRVRPSYPFVRPAGCNRCASGGVAHVLAVAGLLREQPRVAAPHPRGDDAIKGTGGCRERQKPRGVCLV